MISFITETVSTWNKLQEDLKAYKIDRLLEIFQKYVDASSEAALLAK